MNDPHVDELHYRLIHDEFTEYADPARLKIETEAFSVQLADDRAVFKMKEHYSTEEDAGRVVDDYVRAWEIAAGLQAGLHDFRLRFKEAVVIDRTPTPNVITASLRTTTEAVKMDATATRQITEYRTPPTAFVVTLDVQRLYNCYKDYLRTRIEGLLSVAAYKCLKKLEHLAGRNKNTRRAAARKYAICFDVLNELARFVNKYGGPVGSRKDIDTQLYTQEQKAWI